MTEFGPYERVYVENEWYDGPRAGIADIHGVPHRFKSLFDEQEDEFLSTFLVWPVTQKDLELEIEQWHIFVEWNARYESGDVDTESHPGHGGRHARWDEIAALLEHGRFDVSSDAQHAAAQLMSIDRLCRYEAAGPAYLMCWRFLSRSEEAIQAQGGDDEF